MRRVDEGRVGDTTSEAGALQRVEALDEHDLVGRLGVLEEPAVGGGGPDGPRLAVVVRVDRLRGDEVAVGHGAGVSDGEGVLVDSLDGAPDLPA